MILSLDKSSGSNILQPRRTFDDLVTPTESILLRLLLEVEFSDQPVQRTGVEDCRHIVAKLQTCDLFVETIIELTALFHSSQIPKSNSFRRSRR